jgi:hypothetical protein
VQIQIPPTEINKDRDGRPRCRDIREVLLGAHAVFREPRRRLSGGRQAQQGMQAKTARIAGQLKKQRLVIGNSELSAIIHRSLKVIKKLLRFRVQLWN